MIATVIPFLLTTYIEVDNNIWQNGPEYKFQITINEMYQDFDESSFQVNLTVTGHLLCRPKMSDTLSCYLSTLEKNGIRKLLSNDTLESLSLRNKKIKMDNMPFEIKFNNKGIEYLIVPEENETEDEKYNIFKSIANLLSFGTDLRDRSEGMFEDVENFTLGECTVNYYLEHKLINDENVDFEFSLIPSATKLLQETVHLKKKRNLTNCASIDNNVFSILMIGLDKDSMQTNVKQYNSYIAVTNKGFESHTFAKSILSSQKVKMNVKFTKNLDLSLEDISPAKGELPIILNPIITTIHTVPSE